MPRPLPSLDDARRILAVKRTRRPPRPPPKAGRELGSLIKALDDRFGQGPDALAARWREIVGDPLAAHTEPVKLTKPRNGAGATLELKVDGPLAALIQHQAPEILSRVNLALGAGTAVKLRIVQGVIRRKDADAKDKARSATGAAVARRARVQPLDSAQEAELAASVAGAKDDKLKAALIRFGRAVLRKELAGRG